MKVLVIGLNFHPELTGIGKYTGEMVEWLRREGHEVRVVTAPPYYPAWKIGKGYSGYRYRVEEFHGARIIRCPLWVPERPSGIKRIAHLASFAVSSLPVALWQALRWRPDVVWTVEPALFSAPAALMAARLSGAGAWLHVQDFELDAALSLGMLKEGFLKRLAVRGERNLMGRFGRVSTISNKMLRKLGEKGVKEARSLLFPNWVDCARLRPLEGPSPMRRELGIPEDRTVMLYSGNMGEKQGLDIVVEAARILAGDPGLEFVLCGEGAARIRIEEMARDLENVTFLPLQPMERLNELLNVADVHLLPQRADVQDLVMPSKLPGMFATARPVVATARKGSQLAGEVEGRGIVVPPGDAGAMANAIRTLAGDRALRGRLGRAAREHCLERWDSGKVLKEFERELLSFTEGAGRG